MLTLISCLTIPFGLLIIPGLFYSGFASAKDKIITVVTCSILLIIGFSTAVIDRNYKEKYPLKKLQTVLVDKEYNYFNTIFKFENPVRIITYYCDTPWYYFNGGESNIEVIEVVNDKN